MIRARDWKSVATCDLEHLDCCDRQENRAEPEIFLIYQERVGKENPTEKETL